MDKMTLTALLIVAGVAGAGIVVTTITPIVSSGSKSVVESQKTVDPRGTTHIKVLSVHPEDSQTLKVLVKNTGTQNIVLFAQSKLHLSDTSGSKFVYLAYGKGLKDDEWNFEGDENMVVEMGETVSVTAKLSTANALVYGQTYWLKFSTLNGVVSEYRFTNESPTARRALKPKPREEPKEKPKEKPKPRSAPITLFREAYSFTTMPSPGQVGTPWDPQIGVRVAISKAVRLKNEKGDDSTSIYKVDDVNWQIANIGSALSLVLCSDEKCIETQPVSGEVRTLYGGIGGSEAGKVMLLDFFPTTPLFGGRFYKLTISENAKIVWGSNEILFKELVSPSAVQFSTAEMTRFLLPINIKYDNSKCHGGDTGQFAENTGQPMCLNIDQLSELIYGNSENQFNHYFNTMSADKTFAFSPLRDKQGFARPVIEIDRGKNYEVGRCFRDTEVTGSVKGSCSNKVVGPSIQQQMAELFDLDRYRITHENGSPNVLVAYRPSREYAAAQWAMDDGRRFQHRNITVIYNYGTFALSALGAANSPKKDKDAVFTISNEENPRTWVHELGHALFALPDLYASRTEATTSAVGFIDIMGDNNDLFAPMTAWTLISSELAEPQSLISDLEMSNFIYLDEYQLPTTEWTSTSVPAIPAIPGIPAVTYTPEKAFVEVHKRGGGNHSLITVRSVAVSPDGRHVYAAGQHSNSIAVFSRDSSTGSLTFLEMTKDGVGPVDGLAYAYSVTLSPDGSHVYAVGIKNHTIAVFSRDSSTGGLTFIEMHKDGVGGVDGLGGIRSVTVSPDGEHVYTAAWHDHAVALFSRDSSTGALTYVGMYKNGVGPVEGLYAVRSVTVSPDGSHVYTAASGDHSIAVFSRDSSTGALTYLGKNKDGVGPVDGLYQAVSVTVSSDGNNVYAAGSGEDAVAVFSRDSSTGALTFIEVHKDGVSPVDGLYGVKSVTVSSDGSHVYTASIGDNAIAVFSRDLSNGALTYVGVYKNGVGDVDGLDDAYSVTVSPDGNHVYAAGSRDPHTVAVFSPHTKKEPTPLILKRAIPAVPEVPASTAYIGCGTTNDKCTIYDNTQSGFKILKVPAILERDTGKVKGHYLIEFFGTTGYNSNITLAPHTVGFSDRGGDFPGGIAIWKIDNTDQKIMTGMCRQRFAHTPPGWCNREKMINNGSEPAYPEFYPVLPTISHKYGGTGISSFHLFPWWYSPSLPFGNDFEKNLSKMPYSIELPVLEIAPYGTAPSQTTEFGGGLKVAVITLSFQSLVDGLKSRIRAAKDSGLGQLSKFETYEIKGSAEFTIQVRKLGSPVQMTYADHIRRGQMEFITGVLADEIFQYGYHIPKR